MTSLTILSNVLWLINIHLNIDNKHNQASTNRVAPFSFHQCVFYSSSLSLISQWILWTWTFISPHVLCCKQLRWHMEMKEIMFSFFVNNSCRMLCFVKKALFSLVGHTKMSSVFRMGRSLNSMVWKVAKWAKFVPVLTNTHMLKKTRIFVNRISKERQTTCNWIVRILDKVTSVVNTWA